MCSSVSLTNLPSSGKIEGVGCAIVHLKAEMAVVERDICAFLYGLNTHGIIFEDILEATG